MRVFSLNVSQPALPARKRNIFRAAPFESQRGGAPQTVELAGEFDGSDIAFCVARSAGRCGRRSRVLAFRNDRGRTADRGERRGPSSARGFPDEERSGETEARQIVPFHTSEAPGTIIIDTGERYLYLVQPNNLAIRYGIGVGRIGFQWSGVERVSQKQEWPDWRVPSEMVGRQPYLPRFVAGGPGNPLGARALYLGHTVFRIHGTNQPETIGHAVSSGCFRLDNADVIDLYDRVQVGAKVVVRQSTHVS